ncbi:MAG: hypothetical protein HY905_05000 [Deltaproteobacteria bacterium]|nr:hypothetical protein [Deltaproteobacteria bacterium]
MADSIFTGALTVLTAIGLLFGPPAVASVVLHWTERRMTGGLMRIAGRWAVLITGWLGVPIHELSHALMCVIFRHRIEKLVLFHPDPETGTLGYVNHSWNRKNPLHVVGAFFIGMAPLLGGAAVILVLLHVLVPGALAVPQVALPAGPGDSAGWAALGQGLGDALHHTLRTMFTAENVGGWRLWVFLYLSLCVGSHVSPSPQDFKGSLVGGLAVFALLIVGGGIAVAAGAGPRLASLAWTAGLSTGLLLSFVAAINIPLALGVSFLGRFRG